MKKIIFAGLVVTVSVLLMAGGVWAQPPVPPWGDAMIETIETVEPRIPISSLPYTISESGSYYLTGNQTVTGTGITVEADNVTIDLMGFSLTGSNSETGILIMNGHGNVVVTNGIVQGFEFGIKQTSSGIEHRIINVQALSNATNGIKLSGDGHVVKDCTASDNGSHGIIGGYDSKVIDCIVRNNGYDGILTWYGSVVTGNVAQNNFASGIRAYCSTVTNNSAYANKGHGIDASSGCTVVGNTVYENERHGILCNGTVVNNTAIRNEQDGIYAGASSTVIGNTSYGNGENGFYISNGCTVTGNTANANNQNNTPDKGGMFLAKSSLVKANSLNWNYVNNIYVKYDRNVIEENIANNSSGYGIYFANDANFYANNRASGNTLGNYEGSVPTGPGDGGGNVGF